MIQIPNINLEALDQYDHRLMDPNGQKFGEKKRKDQFKKLIAGTVGVMLPFPTREQCFSSMSDCRRLIRGNQRHWHNSARHYSAEWIWLCCKSSVLGSWKMQQLNRAGQSNEILSCRSWIALFNLSSACPLPTESSVPAVQEGGSYPESSIAL